MKKVTNIYEAVIRKHNTLLMLVFIRKCRAIIYRSVQSHGKTRIDSSYGAKVKKGLLNPKLLLNFSPVANSQQNQSSSIEHPNSGFPHQPQSSQTSSSEYQPSRSQSDPDSDGSGVICFPIIIC